MQTFNNNDDILTNFLLDAPCFMRNTISRKVLEIYSNSINDIVGNFKYIQNYGASSAALFGRGL